jgi:hypothetical protein
MRKEITVKNEVVPTKPSKSDIRALKTEVTPDVTFKTIIADLPPAKEVCEYFRNMITDLGRED